MHPAIEKFAFKIQHIEESDFGKFLREANSSLIDLRREMDYLPFDDVHDYLNMMQAYIQFSANWAAESTRLRAMTDAKFLDDLICGHAQDWES